MSQNITRVNTSKRKQSDVREREAAVDEIENEITMLTKNHHEIRDRLKSLKASKTDLRKRKSSSKAESSSSGRIHTMASSAKLKKVSLAAKVGSKKCTSFPSSYCLFFFEFMGTFTTLYQQLELQPKSESR
jgi:chromosome segregation ATPase